MPSWPEYAQQTGDAVLQWLLDHPWSPPADPGGPDPGEPGGTPTKIVRINCGGPTVTDSAGQVWEADRGFTGGQTSAQGAGHYGLDVEMDSERWGNFSYALTGLPVGPATVRLHMAESYPASTAPGGRMFDVAVQGLVALAGLDLVALAGQQYVPVVRDVATAVDAAGRISVALMTVKNAATLQGLEVLCYGTGVPTEPEEPDPDDPGQPKPAAWKSGAYLAGNNYTQAGPDAWGRKFGFTPGLWLVYTTRDKDSDTMWRAPAILNTTAFTDKSLTLLLGQSFAPWKPPTTSGKNSVTADQVLSGSQDAGIKAMAAALKAREASGFAPVIVDLAWEFNGDWMHHSGADAKKFIAAFRYIVRLVRTIHPTQKFAWVANKGYSQNPPSHNPLDLYPGDDVVDIWGVDAYDQYDHALTPAAVQVELNKPGGARWWANLAAQHHRGFLLQEWGIKNAPQAPGDKGGGDNAVFMTAMRGFFQECHDRPDLDFIGECYFDEDNLANVGSSLMTGRNPKSSAKYAELWRR